MIDPKSQIVIIYLYLTMAQTLIGKWSTSQGQYGHMEECHWLAPKSKVRGSHSHRTKKRRGLCPRYQNQIRGFRSEATWSGAHVVRVTPRLASFRGSFVGELWRDSWGQCWKAVGRRPRPYPIQKEPFLCGSHHIKNVLDLSSKHLLTCLLQLSPLTRLFSFIHIYK